MALERTLLEIICTRKHKIRFEDTIQTSDGTQPYYITVALNLQLQTNSQLMTIVERSKHALLQTESGC